MRIADPVPAPAISRTAVRRAVTSVLDGERAGPASMSVTFLSGQQMRALNRRALRRDRATDVIAFRLDHPDRIVGDIYVCPSVARRSARAGSISEREELVRLVVHGTLHVLGYNHPESAARTSSPMWRRQERYIGKLLKELR